MHIEIQKVSNGFDFLHKQFGGEVIESYYDEENFGNVVITYRLGDALIDVIRDRDQIQIMLRDRLGSNLEVSLVNLLLELGLNGRNPPEAFYGANGPQLISEAFEKNFQPIMRAFEQRRGRTGEKGQAAEIDI